MAKRHSDALAITQGACNPSGIAYSIIEACAEIRAEPGFRGTQQICDDPAVRLMVHQLASITHANRFDEQFGGYSQAVYECRKQVEAQ